MNVFTPAALTGVGTYKDESIYSFSQNTRSLTESFLKAELERNNFKRHIKYDMYKAIMETNNPYIIESVRNQAKKFEEEYDDTNVYTEDFMEFKKSPEFGVMDAILESNYNMTEEIEQIKFLSYMKECMILTNPNGHFSQLVNLREATASKIKATIDKAIGAIKRIFQKFMEKLRSIGKNRKPYLEKYKQTILSQKPKAETYEMNDYNEAFKRFQRPIPMLSFNDLKNTCNGIEEDDKMQIAIFKRFQGFSDGFDESKTTIAEHCKDYYMCGANSKKIKVQMQQVNMTDIYNFLYDENKIINNIDSDMKKFEQHMNRIGDEAQKQSEQQANEFANMYGTEVVYSVVNEAYIMEDIQKVSDDSNNQADNNKPASTNLSDNISNVPNTEGDNNDPEKNKDLTKDFDGQLSSNYVKVVNIVLGAKMTSVEMFGKDLFQLVRNHVKNFINDETYVGTQKQGTNYSQNQQQNNPQ